MSASNTSRAFPEVGMQAVRLAYNPGPINAYNGLAPCSPQGKNILRGHSEVEQIEQQRAPALLVSFVYLEGFLKHRERYCFRDWVLDSGAFSAHNSGTIINLQDYIDTAKRLQDEDNKLVEIFSLDVIGDARASLRNCEEMWRQGVEAIPVYHRGSDESFLQHIAENYPKIALGGVAKLRGGKKMEWANQCFARVWPKRIHGFGFGSEDQVLGLPWHSVDATNWEIGPCAFGQWKKFGKMSVRGSNQNLRSQVEYYLDLEHRARVRWRREMSQLAAMPTGRLALQGGARPESYAHAFTETGPGLNKNDRKAVKQAALLPDVRLAYHPEGGATLCAPSILLAMSGDKNAPLGGANHHQEVKHLHHEKHLCS